VGLAGEFPVMHAFQISEHDASWEQVEYAIAGD
jgi:hypothetical protein